MRKTVLKLAYSASHFFYCWCPIIIQIFPDRYGQHMGIRQLCTLQTLLQQGPVAGHFMRVSVTSLVTIYNLSHNQFSQVLNTLLHDGPFARVAFNVISEWISVFHSCQKSPPETEGDVLPIALSIPPS